MGYERKLYVVEKGHAKNSDGMRYAHVVAMFDMCKVGFFGNVFEHKTDCYFYADDGDTKVVKDRYGDDLKEATVKDVINVLEEAVKKGDEYRRIFPLLSALKTIDEQQKGGIWREIVVLHYGY